MVSLGRMLLLHHGRIPGLRRLHVRHRHRSLAGCDTLHHAADHAGATRAMGVVGMVLNWLLGMVLTGLLSVLVRWHRHRLLRACKRTLYG